MCHLKSGDDGLLLLGVKSTYTLKGLAISGLFNVSAAAAIASVVQHIAFEHSYRCDHQVVFSLTSSVLQLLGQRAIICLKRQGELFWGEMCAEGIKAWSNSANTSRKSWKELEGVSSSKRVTL